MSCDGELDVGIVDENNTFARDLRVALWREHMGDQTLNLDNPLDAFNLFEEYTSNYELHWLTENGAPASRLRPYPLDFYPQEPAHHQLFMPGGIDPYRGPEIVYAVTVGP